MRNAGTKIVVLLGLLALVLGWSHKDAVVAIASSNQEDDNRIAHAVDQCSAPFERDYKEVMASAKHQKEAFFVGCGGVF